MIQLGRSLDGVEWSGENTFWVFLATRTPHSFCCGADFLARDSAETDVTKSG